MSRLLGSIMAAPYELLFFLVWSVSSLARPLLVFTLVCVVSNPSAAWRKLQLFGVTVQYLIWCKDKKFKIPAEDPASFFPDPKSDKIVRKTIIFVRHGESTWNDTFNKGDRNKIGFIINFVPNLLYAIAIEWYFWVAGKPTESWFFDAPLSEKGKGQAEGVKKYLTQDPSYLTPKEANLMRLLRGGDSKVEGDDTCKASSSSQLVSSNLRRAIATMAIGFQDRLDKKYAKDSMLILPALQEISSNPDASSITPAHGTVVPAWTDPFALNAIYETQVDTSKHTGNKPIDSNGLKRLREFCKVVFEDVDKECVIAAGHSLWFRSFFKTFLPRSNTHVSKTKKLVNGGVVGFTLARVENRPGNYEYMIDSTSIAVLHGGF